MPLVGADIAALRELAATYVAQSEVLRDGITTVDLLVDSTTWAGADADEFRSTWHSELRSQMLAAADSLTEAAKTLHRNADEQEQASMDDGSAPAIDPREVADKVGKKIRDLFEGLFGGHDKVKQEPRVVSTEVLDLSYGGSVFFLGGKKARTMVVETLSDGTSRVIVTDDDSVYYTGGPGEAYGEITVGDTTISAGAEAGLYAGLHLGNGSEYTFDNPEDLKDFTDWMKRQTGKDAAADLMLGSHGLLDNPLSRGLIDGVYNQFDRYRPPEPTATFVEGGSLGGGNASAGSLSGGGGSGSIDLTNSLGMRTDKLTGETTTYIRVDGSMSGDVRAAPTVGANGSLDGSLLVAATADKNGKITEVTMTTTGTAEGAYSAFNLPGTSTGLADAGGKSGTFEITVPVTDANRESVTKAMEGLGVVSAVSDPIAANVAAALIAHEAYTNGGTVTMQAYDVQTDGFRVTGSLGLPVIDGIGLDVSGNRTTTTETKHFAMDDDGTWH